MALTWREREHEAQDMVVSSDPPMVQYLGNCGLLKFYMILGMRAQLELLDYLVRCWDT